MNRERALRQLKALKKFDRELRLAAEWTEPWKILISTILSARTRDEVTINVCDGLFKKYPTVRHLAKAPLRAIQNIVRPVNYYKTKSKNILNCAKDLVKHYKGIIPVDFSLLIELPGVGRKTANVFLSEMGKDAIAVDTHVAYISHKLGWTTHRRPDKIEEDLKKLFPKRLWRKVNPVLVRVGRTYRGKKREDILAPIKEIN